MLRLVGPLVGIFVGGASRRMGGRPKGRLSRPVDGRPIVAALIEEARAARLDVVLVGRADAYRDLAPDVPVIEDDPPAIGPLGGLRALLVHAGERRAIALGCDMPHVDRDALAWLRGVATDACVAAARRTPDAPFEPLFARYDPARVLPELDRAIADGVRGFQQLFARIDVEVLDIPEEHARALEDWDCPEDVPGEGHRPC